MLQYVPNESRNQYAVTVLQYWLHSVSKRVVEQRPAWKDRGHKQKKHNTSYHEIVFKILRDMQPLGYFACRTWCPLFISLYLCPCQDLRDDLIDNMSRGAWTVEQPLGSVLEYYNTFRRIVKCIFHVGGPYAVP